MLPYIPQSKQAFTLLILSVFFTGLQSEVLGTLCKELKLTIILIHSINKFLVIIIKKLPQFTLDIALERFC